MKFWVFLRDKNAVLSLFKDKLTPLFWGQTGSDQHRGACCRYSGLEGQQQLLELREVFVWGCKVCVGSLEQWEHSPVSSTSGNGCTKGLKSDELWHRFPQDKIFLLGLWTI